MRFFRQFVLVAILVLAALWGWLRYVPSAAPWFERAGVMGWLREHDRAILGLSLLPPAPEGAAVEGGAPPGGGRSGGFGGRGATAVVAAPAAPGVMNDVFTAIGDGQALRTVTVTPEASGRIVALAVAAGDTVALGQLIARLDDDAERIARERAELVREDARERVARQQRLYESGTASDVALRDAQLALRTAELGVQQAEYDLARRAILAPIQGVVGLIAVEVGDQVGPATAITRIDDRSRVLVEFALPERFVGRLAPGDAVTAERLARPGQRYQGTVRALDNLVDPSSRSMKVRAELDNVGDELRSGMAFSIRIGFAGEPWPAVDPLAIQWDDGGAFVWVVREGKAARVAVRIMQRNADSVLVRGEIAVGEAVITEGVQLLRPGAAVQVQGAEAAAGAAAGAPRPGSSRPGTGRPAGEGPAGEGPGGKRGAPAAATPPGDGAASPVAGRSGRGA